MDIDKLLLKAFARNKHKIKVYPLFHMNIYVKKQ